jgi:hypothetical protein
MTSVDDLIEKATAKLPEKNTYKKGDRIFLVRSLFPHSLWRSLKDPLWKGKEAYPIGTGDDGNLFLRHCDGSVRYWNPKTGQDEVLSSSVRDFLAHLGAL